MKYGLFASILVYSLIALWYVAPWLRRQGRADALTALLWVHVFRYCVIYLFKAQQEGYAITDTALMQLVVGDFAGAIIALAAIWLLRRRSAIGIAAAWLLLAESIVDFIVGTHQRTVDPPRGDATGVWWLIFTFFAPLILVSLPLLTWQLYSRRQQPL